MPDTPRPGMNITDLSQTVTEQTPLLHTYNPKTDGAYNGKKAANSRNGATPPTGHVSTNGTRNNDPVYPRKHAGSLMNRGGSGSKKNGKKGSDSGSSSSSEIYKEPDDDTGNKVRRTRKRRSCVFDTERLNYEDFEAPLRG